MAIKMSSNVTSNNSADGKVEGNENDLSNSDIVTKYRTAANIANLTLQKLISEVKTGASIKALCKMGDDMILAETAKVYNKKENGRKIEKGIAFPTSVSLNEICDNYSPIEDGDVISDGDMVKIFLGCHIDGYLGLVAHTVFNGEKVTGRAADVLTAAWTCCEAALREMKVGNSSHNVSKVIEQVAGEFKCTPVMGYVSHEIKRHVIEGSRYFTNSTRVEEKTEAFTFGLNEAYGLNVIVSTGEGKPKATEHKTTIYRAEVQNRYTLKTTLGRAFISQVNSRFPTLPFHISSFEDERVLKAGLPEAVRHKLITPYPVESEKAGEIVAHFTFVVLLLAGGTKKITGVPFAQQSVCTPEHSIQDEVIIKLLAVSHCVTDDNISQTSVNPKTKKANKTAKVAEKGAENNGESAQ
ncbi:Proliferation-associated protein 2G4 [Babesia sp. Xinjiang]|uniref:Proliferation-associated protein 2G4 n=1 Tax=Babesia sp. Xinjiang TaxID=462227 RepID=UPI000A264C2C|nr:Proliferation-associated protein 2G4 [Babesia sp. Xinjiang]ORM39735.1 Proliferation-associated protein 2G4 [Babesia sp. Xinjiang]